MKKRWFVVTLVVGVLALGVTGGDVLAQDTGEERDSPVEKLTSRVVAILGLDEFQVQDAFDQARREMRDEPIQLKLDRMVESGRLTQEQADAYRDWYMSRPEGLCPGFKLGGIRGHGFHRGGMMGEHGMGFWNQMPHAPAPESSDATSLWRRGVIR